MLITIAAAIVAIAVTSLLTFSAFAKTENWRATVTPLASIIGSGFLISGPILAKEFGGAALLAMAILLAIAYAVGAVIRFNIQHTEAYLAQSKFHGKVAWLTRLTQGVLSLAYAVSVAYYLKLLAEFSLKPLSVPDHLHTLVSNLAVTAIIVVLMILALAGGLRRIEHLAHGTVSLKIGIIAGLVAALGIWWALHIGQTEAPPPVRMTLTSIPLLLGLLITVQGFETSRYLGEGYPAAVRIRTMKWAQWVASGIYLVFLALLTPFLASAASAEGVAGILDVMVMVGVGLGAFVLIGAVASQLSAAVADSIGAAGLLNEISHKRLSVPLSFVTSGALAIAVVWLTNPFEVVAVSSRAFALYYALQCAVAVSVGTKTGAASPLARAGFVLIGLVALVAALVGAPAE